MRPDVSVCVATCRRPAGLARLLESLARQKLPGRLALEVVVVDNDAAGSAAEVLERFAAALPLRSFVEPRRNVAHARNRCVEEARGHWLAFVDDDEAADEGWLAAYWDRADAGDADGLFGPVRPRLEEVVTPWLEAERFYARPRHATGAPLAAESLATNNAFLRRTLFVGQRFDPAFGRSGGSDSELFARMQREGARFFWCDEALVDEFVPPERHRLAWLARRAFRGGVVHTRVEARERGRWRCAGRVAPRALAGLVGFGAASGIAAAAGPAAAASPLLRACTQAGHLWALLGGGFEEYGGE